jgi:hypothetical protein
VQSDSEVQRAQEQEFPRLIGVDEDWSFDLLKHSLLLKCSLTRTLLTHTTLQAVGRRLVVAVGQRTGQREVRAGEGGVESYLYSGLEDDGKDLCSSAGLVGEYAGLVGEYAGLVGEYAGLVGEYAGLVGE